MSKTKFCNQCGAPLQPKALFCERCGALAGTDGDDSQAPTEKLPTSQPQSQQSQQQGHSEVQPPIPVMQAPRQPHPQIQTQAEKKPEEHKGDKHDSEVMGWVIAIALAILLATLVGYVAGTSGTSKDTGKRVTTDDKQEQEWQYGTYGSDEDDDTDKKASQKATDSEADKKTDSKDTESKNDSTDKKDDGKSDSKTDEKGGTDGTSKPTDDKADGKDSDKDTSGTESNTKDDKKDADTADKKEESPDTKRMRDSINHEMGVRPDGMLHIGLSVPDDGAGISERVEITQDGRLVYSTRIVAPGETLEWVPSDHAHAGKAKATIYGIKGEQDWGSPVTVEVDVVNASALYIVDQSVWGSSQI